MSNEHFFQGYNKGTPTDGTAINGTSSLAWGDKVTGSGTGTKLITTAAADVKIYGAAAKLTKSATDTDTCQLLMTMPNTAGSGVPTKAVRGTLHLIVPDMSGATFITALSLYAVGGPALFRFRFLPNGTFEFRDSAGPLTPTQANNALPAPGTLIAVQFVAALGAAAGQATYRGRVVNPLAKNAAGTDLVVYGSPVMTTQGAGDPAKELDNVQWGFCDAGGGSAGKQLVTGPIRLELNAGVTEQLWPVPELAYAPDPGYQPTTDAVPLRTIETVGPAWTVTPADKNPVEVIADQLDTTLLNEPQPPAAGQTISRTIALRPLSYQGIGAGLNLRGKSPQAGTTLQLQVQLWNIRTNAAITGTQTITLTDQMADHPISWPHDQVQTVSTSDWERNIAIKISQTG